VSNIVPVLNTGISNPYSMTNAGLRITLPMMQLTSPESARQLPTYRSRHSAQFGILDCVKDSLRPGTLLAIQLERLSDDSDSYVRVFGTGLYFVPSSQKSRSPNKTVYILSRTRAHAVLEAQETYKASADVGFLASWFFTYRAHRMEVVSVRVSVCHFDLHV